VTDSAPGVRRPCIGIVEPDRGSSLLFPKFFETVWQRASPYRARPNRAVAAGPGYSYLGAFLVRARNVDEERAACTNADGGFEILAAEWSGQAGRRKRGGGFYRQGLRSAGDESQTECGSPLSNVYCNEVNFSQTSTRWWSSPISCALAVSVRRLPSSFRWRTPS
jgi:hypothetical protein